VTSSLAVFEAAIWVKINAYDKIMIKSEKKEISKQINKSPSKR